MNKYLLKIAEKQEQATSPHHEEVLSRLEKNKGVVAQHSMGSGKTLLALRAAERVHQKDPNKYIAISAPASVIKQFPDEAKKFNVKLNEKNVGYFSHEELSNRAHEIAKRKPGLLVVDEGHRLRNTSSKKNQTHTHIRAHSDKALIMTGTGAYNKVHDIAPLVNLATGEKTLPDKEHEFNKKYITETHHRPGLFHRLFGAETGTTQSLDPKAKKHLGKVLNTTVHNYDAKKDTPHHFAKKTETIIETEMSPEQHKYYKFAEDKIPLMTRLKIRHGLPMSKKESANLNAFSSAVRQASNSHAGFTKNPETVPSSPKFKRMLERRDEIRHQVGHKNYRGIVYSNYMDSGLVPYQRMLKAKGVNSEIYHGGLTKTEKANMVKRYNDGHFDTMLISSSGAEGLNLKGVRHVQTMEPHFNESKIQQVIARGIRRGSHAHLPKEDRHVHVDRYHSVLPKRFLQRKPDQAIDGYLHNMSKEKEKIKKEMNSLIN